MTAPQKVKAETSHLGSENIQTRQFATRRAGRALRRALAISCWVAQHSGTRGCLCAGDRFAFQNALMRHDHRQFGVLQHLARGAAEQPFAEPRMTIGAHDNQVGAHVARLLAQGL